MLTKKVVAAAAAALLAGVAQAQTLNFQGTADNFFTAVLSSDKVFDAGDAVIASNLANPNDWMLVPPYEGNAALTGPSWLLVMARNVEPAPAPGPAMFVADLSITGGGYQFANGATTLSTGTTHWEASRSASFADPFAPANVASGYAGANPGQWAFDLGPDWGASKFIWGTADFSDTTIYLATPINLDTQITVVPEPQAYALALAGLAVMGVLARRRRPQG
jgi:hypothetical protein